MLRHQYVRACAALLMLVLLAATWPAGSVARAAGISGSAHGALAGGPRPLVVWSMPHHGQTAPPGNFPFQTTTSADGKVIIHYYNRPADFGARALNVIEGYLAHPIEDTLGFTLKRTFTIYIYANRADFLAGAQPSDPAITGAYTDTTSSTIYIPLSDIPSDDAASSLAHEMTHVVFHQNEDAGKVESGEIEFYPRWLDEGLAEHDVIPGSSEDLFDTADLQAAVATGGVLNLFQYFIFNYPTDPTIDDLCYAEARSFIGYLITTYGATRFHQFLAALHDGAILQNAELYFGADLQTLQNNWRRSIGTTTLPHDAGNPARLPTAQPFSTGTLGGLATQTQLYDIAGQDQFSGDTLRITFYLTLLALLAIAIGWFQMLQRRRRVAAVRTAEALLGIGGPAPSALGMAPPATPGEPGNHDAQATPTLPLPQVHPSAAYPLSRDGGQGTGKAGLRPTKLPHVIWWEMAVIALVTPVILGIALIWPKIGAAVEWSQSFHAAEVGALIGVVALGGLAVLAGVQRRLTVAYLAGVLIAVAAFGAAHTEASVAGLAQGKAYEAQGAYALAARVFTDAGVPGSAIARVQSEWAKNALDLKDYAAAVTHLRAAVSAAPTTQGYRVALLNAVSTWGQALTGAQMYAQAVQVYQDELQSSTCDAICQTTLQSATGQAQLTWANVLLLSGKTSDALAKVHAVASAYPKTPAGASALRILANQTKALSAALTAGNAGDFAAMNILLQLAAHQRPHTALAAEASEVPEEVTGQIVASANPAGNRIFFAAFTSHTAATNYFNVSDDESVFKIASTIQGNGSYSVRLVPGYWYLVFWEDDSQKYFINASIAPDYRVFFVQPYTVQDEGTITGY